MRINARLDEPLAVKLTHLEVLTGKTTSTVIREALELYYEQVCHPLAHPANIFNKYGFVGIGSGSPELSETYKQAVFENKA